MPPRPQPAKYCTSRRTRLSAASARSYTYNPRNLEDPWYPVYRTTFSELVDKLDPTQSLVVMDNYLIFLSSAERDLLRQLGHGLSEDDREWYHVEHSPKDKPQTLPANESLDEATQGIRERDELLAATYAQRQEDAANAPAAEDDLNASRITVPDGGALQIKPDFLVAHMNGDITEKPSDESLELEEWCASMGYHTRHQCFPLIGEVKPLPSRSRTSRRRQDLIRRLLQTAETDLFSYLAIVFARDLSAQKVVAVSATGIYWRWCSFERSEAPFYDNYVPLSTEKQRKFLAKFNRVKWHTLGTEESDRELNKMWTTALSSFLTDHPDYPLTMMPNVEKEKQLKEEAKRKAEQA